MSPLDYACLWSYQGRKVEAWPWGQICRFVLDAIDTCTACCGVHGLFDPTGKESVAAGLLAACVSSISAIESATDTYTVTFNWHGSSAIQDCHALRSIGKQSTDIAVDIEDPAILKVSMMGDLCTSRNIR